MRGKNSFSLLPQLNRLVVAPVNVTKYHSDISRERFLPFMEIKLCRGTPTAFLGSAAAVSSRKRLVYPWFFVGRKVDFPAVVASLQLSFFPNVFSPERPSDCRIIVFFSSRSPPVCSSPHSLVLASSANNQSQQALCSSLSTSLLIWFC